MGDSGVCCGRNQLLVDLEQGVVVLTVIKGALDAAESTLMFWCSRDRAGEPKGANCGNLFWMEKVDACESDACSTLGEFFQGVFFEAPTADGLRVRHKWVVVVNPVSAMDESMREKGLR